MTQFVSLVFRRCSVYSFSDRIVGYDHMPYLPFPPSWPVYTPALKLADWLESYAHSLELNVWTSANVVSIERETKDSGKRWSVLVERDGGRKRTLKVDHVVLALGPGGGLPKYPDIPGQVSHRRYGSRAYLFTTRIG